MKKPTLRDGQNRLQFKINQKIAVCEKKVYPIFIKNARQQVFGKLFCVVILQNKTTAVILKTDVIFGFPNDVESELKNSCRDA